MSDIRIAPISPEIPSSRVQIDSPKTSGAASETSTAAAPTAATAIGGAEARPQYISPFSRIDAASGLVVTEYRNTVTGELLNQFPNQAAVQEYRLNGPANVVTRAEAQSRLAATATVKGATPAPSASASSATVAPTAGQPSPTPQPTPAPVATPVATPAVPAPTSGGSKTN